MFLVYNSDILHESDFRLSVNDRAFSYGDGIFETIRYESNRIWFWRNHFARLSAGMAALHLTPPENFTADGLHQTLLRLLDANGLSNQPARIKLQVWRQAGGLYTPKTNSVNVLLSALPGNPFSISEKAQTGIYEEFRLAPSPLSAYKTLNALPYVLAGVYKEQHALNDVLLLDTEGHMAECLASSLFWYTRKTLYTPSLRTGCIDGIIRRQLLRLAPDLGIPVHEGLYKPDVLQQAEAVFCANVMGIQWLNQVDSYIINTSVTTKERLESLLNQLHI
ncbi:aminotransferase class IV [Spirosoma fluviale]|uniref:branched-chain-amino-acid transaminase n=1 Tax=Spirosoma fluviale TaxID=1597977 RepID=A0A286GSR7_9BACT|nr:aminotransferase class IV [Spirosoma fluviale]SOD98601.1 branched-chain amino acid aminotransferase/4-amino-4-deoxychorismate lyase [Spirosoma fluviale]